jgi:hypothetical protein
LERENIDMISDTDYETAMSELLNAAQTIGAQLEREGHAAAAPLKAEWRKAVLARGTWRAAKWVALAAANFA